MQSEDEDDDDYQDDGDASSRDDERNYRVDGKQVRIEKSKQIHHSMHDIRKQLRV